MWSEKGEGAGKGVKVVSKMQEAEKWTAQWENRITNLFTMVCMYQHKLHVDKTKNV